MARNMAFIGGEFQVNLLDPLPRNLPPPENGLLGAQLWPAVTVLLNGNFVVVYQNDAGGAGDNDIMAVEFTPAGLAGSVFRVDFDAGDQTSPDVAPRLAGGYVAVWTEETDDSIHLVAVPPGALTNPAPEFAVAPHLADSLLDEASIATFADGRYIVSYTRDFIGVENNDVYFAVVTAAGNGYVKAPTALADHPALNEENSAVATSGNLAAIVYEEGIGGFSDIRLKIVNSAGTIVDTETVVDIAGLTNLPDVATLADGRFVIVWNEAKTTQDISGRIYDPATGTFSTAAFLIAAGPGDELFSTVTGLPDGGFLATWTEAPGPGTVHARRFDASGTPVGDAFLLDTGTPGQFFTVVATNSAGVVFAAWVNGIIENTTDPDIGIQGQLLLALTEVVNGTPGNDAIQTYGLSESINGLDGDDTILAAGGDDLIDAGKGNDLLDGQAGNDWLIGGLGKDKQFGGLGADKFDFNKLAESKVGAALRDSIKDFRHSEGDRIDLKDIDADTNASPGNQKFKFIGADAFSGTDRELRFANGIVQGDTNGDGIANFEIKVATGGVALVAGDFVL